MESLKKRVNASNISISMANSCLSSPWNGIDVETLGPLSAASPGMIMVNLGCVAVVVSAVAPAPSGAITNIGVKPAPNSTASVAG